jgi:hypothetical protein
MDDLCLKQALQTLTRPELLHIYRALKEAELLEQQEQMLLRLLQRNQMRRQTLRDQLQLLTTMTCSNATKH